MDHYRRQAASCRGDRREIPIGFLVSEVMLQQTQVARVEGIIRVS